MAPKRPHDDAQKASLSRKPNQGFSVGPANLPDGTHRRKVQKIKKGLIHKAKLKKEYAKLQARDDAPVQTSAYYDNETQEERVADGPEPTLEPHPDRLKMLQEASPGPVPGTEDRSGSRSGTRSRQRPHPFDKETEIGRQKKEKAAALQKARDEADKERARKLAERERFRKTMAKARHGGPNGQRKLGRESTVLLEKARRLVGKS